MHCAVGVSRSASLVLAYLMIKHHLRLVEAIKIVKEHRWISPNRGFLKHLQNLDVQLQQKKHCWKRKPIYIHCPEPQPPSPLPMCSFPWLVHVEKKWNKWCLREEIKYNCTWINSHSSVPPSLAQPALCAVELLCLSRCLLPDHSTGGIHMDQVCYCFFANARGKFSNCIQMLCTFESPLLEKVTWQASSLGPQFSCEKVLVFQAWCCGQGDFLRG